MVVETLVMVGVWLLTGLVVLLLLGGGAYLVKTGLYIRGQGQKVAEADPTPAAAVSPGQGQVAVTGTARPIESEGAIVAPFSGAQAVVCRSAVSEKTGDSATNLHAELETVPFTIEDGSGSVRVDPHEDAYYNVEHENYSVTSASDRTPAIQEWLDRTGAVSAGPGRGRTYRQHLIMDGETATVIGQPRAVEDDEWGETTVELVGGDDPEEMVLTDRDAEGMTSSTNWRAAVMILAGALFGLLGAGLGLMFLLMTLVVLGELL